MEKVLEIDGEVITPLSLSVDDVRQRYQPYTVQTSFLNEDRQLTTIFVGARLWDIVFSAQARVSPTSSLRINARASDGFRCLIRWHEIDPALTDRIILVAYEQDDEPLGAGGGPLRLVVPGDERGRRYLRGLARITVLAQTADDEKP